MKLAGNGREILEQPAAVAAAYVKQAVGLEFAASWPAQASQRLMPACRERAMAAWILLRMMLVMQKRPEVCSIAELDGKYELKVVHWNFLFAVESVAKHGRRRACWRRRKLTGVLFGANFANLVGG